MTRPKDTKEKEEPRGFGAILGEIDEGGFIVECSEELHDLVKKLSDVTSQTGNKSKGKLTITLELLHRERGHVDVVGVVTTKAPKAKAAASVFYATKGLNLSRVDPKQIALPLRDVSAPREAADVDAPTPAAPIGL